LAENGLDPLLDVGASVRSRLRKRLDNGEKNRNGKIDSVSSISMVQHVVTSLLVNRKGIGFTVCR